MLDGNLSHYLLIDLNSIEGFYQNRMHGSIKGAPNSTAIKESKVVVVAIPAAATFPFISEFREYFNPKQIVVSTVVPIKKREKFYVYTPISVKDIISDEKNRQPS